jgi:hypothetical protein
MKIEIKKNKLKAKELVDKFMFISDRRTYDAKQCALICVDEKLEFLKKIAFYIDSDNYHFIKNEVIKEKQEIEKL